MRVSILIAVVAVTLLAVVDSRYLSVHKRGELRRRSSNIHKLLAAVKRSEPLVVEETTEAPKDCKKVNVEKDLQSMRDAVEGWVYKWMGGEEEHLWTEVHAILDEKEAEIRETEKMCDERGMITDLARAMVDYLPGVEEEQLLEDYFGWCMDGKDWAGIVELLSQWDEDVDVDEDTLKALSGQMCYDDVEEVLGEDVMDALFEDDGDDDDDEVDSRYLSAHKRGELRRRSSNIHKFRAAVRRSDATVVEETTKAPEQPMSGEGNGKGGKKEGKGEKGGDCKKVNVEKDLQSMREEVEEWVYKWVEDNYNAWIEVEAILNEKEAEIRETEKMCDERGMITDLARAMVDYLPGVEEKDLLEDYFGWCMDAEDWSYLLGWLSDGDEGVEKALEELKGKQCYDDVEEVLGEETMDALFEDDDEGDDDEE